MLRDQVHSRRATCRRLRVKRPLACRPLRTFAALMIGLHAPAAVATPSHQGHAFSSTTPTREAANPAAQCTEGEFDERLRLTFVAGTAGAKSRLATKWTGREPVRVSVWIDVDADGAWEESERVAAGAALAPGIKVFDYEALSGRHVQAETRLRVRIEEDGPGGTSDVRESIRAISGGDGTPPACGWSPGFTHFDLDDSVNDLAIYDDGGGPALYAGGTFTTAGEVIINHIAKWDGSTWSTLDGPEGIGTDQGVLSLVVYDDGSGPALIAGGVFSTAGGVPAARVARWDGSDWSALVGSSGEGLQGQRVSALAVYDDGSGSALYAGGSLFMAGGVGVANIAKWNGNEWTALAGPSGMGTDEEVFALAVYDDGGGPAVYAGGRFTHAGGVPVNGIAKWDGDEWSALSGPSGTGTNSWVYALAAYDDGTEPALYAGGIFSQAGGVTVNRIARWDGDEWSALSGPSGTGTDDWVRSLEVFDDGSGPALYLGGRFTQAGGLTVNGIAEWDGNSWSALSGPSGTGIVGSVATLAGYVAGGGPVLYAGGELFNAGGVPVNYITSWHGGAWSALTSTSGAGMGAVEIRAFAIYDDGQGPALYAAGDFEMAGGVPANSIARWDGKTWSALSGPAANGLDGRALALAIYDDDGGPALYVGGDFSHAGGVAASNIAKWDGTAWSALGAPGRNGTSNTVAALGVYDDGTGAALYAGGFFATAGGVTVNNIVGWNGTSWSALSGSGGVGTSGPVEALTTYDDGSGAALYVGGIFSTAGGVIVNSIAKWKGSVWSGLSGPFEIGVDGVVRALAQHDDGAGPALYAGGSFSDAGGVFADSIAKWDGASWSPLTGTLGTAMVGSVNALAEYDGGSGPALHVAGDFVLVGGGLLAQRIAKWDDIDWSVLSGPAGEGIGGRTVAALAVYDDGEDPALYAGGRFGTAGGIASRNLARWFCTSEVFADGFESGDLSAWSEATGAP